METWNREQFWAELDALPEVTVKERIATGFYGDGGPRRELAELWLRSKEEERSRATTLAQASSVERQASAAEVQASAAERALKYARTANIIAATALVAAMMSLATSIASLIVSLRK